MIITESFSPYNPMMNSYFVIVSSNDTPVYEADFFKPEAALRVL